MRRERLSFSVESVQAVPGGWRLEGEPDYHPRHWARPGDRFDRACREHGRKPRDVDLVVVELTGSFAIVTGVGGDLLGPDAYSAGSVDDHVIVCAPDAAHDWADLVQHNTWAHECVRLDFAGPGHWSGDWPLGDAWHWKPDREDVPSWFGHGDDLISWGHTVNGDFLFWHVRPGTAAEDWPVVLKERGPYWEQYHVGFSATLVGLLTGEIQSEYLSRWLGGPHSYAL